MGDQMKAALDAVTETPLENGVKRAAFFVIAFEAATLMLKREVG